MRFVKRIAAIAIMALVMNNVSIGGLFSLLAATFLYSILIKIFKKIHMLPLVQKQFDKIVGKAKNKELAVTILCFVVSIVRPLIAFIIVMCCRVGLIVTGGLKTWIVIAAVLFFAEAVIIEPEDKML